MSLGLNPSRQGETQNLALSPSPTSTTVHSRVKELAILLGGLVILNI
jgi:hypothetical protein